MLEETGQLDALFQAIIKLVGDASADVRSQSRLSFAEICMKWPDKKESLLSSIDLTTRKQLLANIKFAESAPQKIAPSTLSAPTTATTSTNEPSSQAPSLSVPAPSQTIVEPNPLIQTTTTESSSVIPPITTPQTESAIPPTVVQIADLSPSQSLAPSTIESNSVPTTTTPITTTSAATVSRIQTPLKVQEKPTLSHGMRFDFFFFILS